MSVSIENALPPIPAEIKERMANWEPNHRLEFAAEYNRMSRSPGIMQLFAMVFPIQHFLLGRWGTGIVFMFTMPFAVIAGLASAADANDGPNLGALLMPAGIIWYIVEWFITQRRVREYNQALAEGLFQRIDRLRPTNLQVNVLGVVELDTTTPES